LIFSSLLHLLKKKRKHQLLKNPLKNLLRNRHQQKNKLKNQQQKKNEQ
jgi:hypothetical protein